ncbi:hypothetical protein [Exiguobacterium sp. s192]|jgi:uncharacterized membrane protein|uniref:hypothetical protein n=2 Tax=Bacillales Family XII. Incertae Sedis TaxID=539742 RepID=UPI00054DA620|nr:hypothetical protein [Exiguobacterium sp. s192]
MKNNRLDYVKLKENKMKPKTIVWLVLLIAAINLAIGIWVPESPTRTTISSVLLGLVVLLGIGYFIALRHSSK